MVWARRKQIRKRGSIACCCPPQQSLTNDFGPVSGLASVELWAPSHAGVASHTECRERKPVNRQGSGAARRKGWFPFQELQRSHCLFTGFPSGVTRKASAALRSLEIAPLSLRERALHLPFLVTSLSAFSMRHYTGAQ